ncbi:TolC family protein [Mycetohabitans endofungorum]|nr:TolC family protein [Mycetohabitans sp. B3]MCF2135203.1 TolC family protein [Mycetohabitans sp. B3]
MTGELSRPLRLQDAVARALCHHPKTRQAWAHVKVQAAAVGASRAAFLPSVSGSWQHTHGNTANDVTGHPQFKSDYRTNLQNANISLSWTLYDFGGRVAGLRYANELVTAALATQQATLLEVFATVVKNFYAAQAAHGALTAAQEMEQVAKASVDAATARVDRGVAAISDQLQAQTAYAAAAVNRVQAENEWQSAIGTLASNLNLAPTTAILLPGVEDGVTPDQEFNDSVTALMDDVQRNHPSVAAAQAQMVAAQSKAVQIRAEGLPRLNLVAQYNYNNQPTSVQLGSPVFPATHREWYVGFQVTIPIFEGFVRTYQVRQADAQIELQSSALDEIRRQAGLDVWNSYQLLQSATQNLGNSSALLSLAQRSYDAANHRYRKNVGNMLELLNAQSALANAKRQRIQALTDWRSARLQLAAKLGKLGMWDLDKA